MKPDRFLFWTLVPAAFYAAASSPAAAADIVHENETGAVQSSCIREEKTKHLICVAVYSKPPYLGFQLGSEDDPESVAVTAGARRAPDSELRIKVDHYAPHHVFGEGFTGKEAEALRDEVEQGTTATVSYEMEDEKEPSTGRIDLTDLKAALREIESLRALDDGK
jgi:hypothetical protein